ncbi:MAG: radical SAM protein [Myxococcota bacterium]
MSELGPRPRSLPIAPRAKPSRTHLPLADEVRPIDSVRPIYAVWEITLRCDLACRHCGSRAGHARPDELSTDEALDMVRQMADLGVREVSLIGGEAYLRDDWDRIAAALVGAGIECGMTTGGRGITRERAQRAKDAGIGTVSVSIDGLEHTHDQLRAVEGSHRAAVGALEHLHAVGMPISVNTQICQPNRKQIEPLFELLHPLGIHSWQVQITVAMGRAADEPDLLLQPYQMVEVMPMVMRLQERTEQVGVRLWPGTNVGYFGPYEGRFRRHMPRGHGTGCGAGRDTLGLEANGDIKGCPSLPTDAYVGGNVREHGLQAVWERSKALRFTRGRKTEDLWGYCASCYYADVCKAGCTWTSHVLSGRRGNNPVCHHRALDLMTRGRRERLVRVQPATGEPFDHARFEIVEEDWPESLLPWARTIAETGQGWLDEPPPG